MNNKSLYLIIFISLLSAFLLSCGKSNKTFSEEESKIIDSLFRVRLKASTARFDSICDSVYNAKFPLMVDSIKRVRKKEVLDLIE